MIGRVMVVVMVVVMIVVMVVVMIVVMVMVMMILPGPMHRANDANICAKPLTDPRC